MQFESTYKALEDFSDRVIERARKNLNLTGFARKGKKINASKRLSKGLGYEIELIGDRLTAIYTSKEDYAPFVEEGRDPSKKRPSHKMIMSIVRWMRKKPIRLRSKGGQFKQKTAKSFLSAAWGIATKTLKDGSEPTRFFGEAIDYEFKDLPPQIREAMVEDMEGFITTAFKKTEFINVTQKT